MHNYEEQIAITFHTLQCGNCGVWHAIPEEMHNTALKEGGFWHCPNGHGRGYKEGQKKRDEKNLKKQLERAKKEKQWAIQEQENLKKSLSAQKGINTKLKNRAKAGVCPCCNRTFKQLAAHMKNKHPDFNESK